MEILELTNTMTVKNKTSNWLKSRMRRQSKE